jgi:hypothetical protein
MKTQLRLLLILSLAVLAFAWLASSLKTPSPAAGTSVSAISPPQPSPLERHASHAMIRRPLLAQVQRKIHETQSPSQPPAVEIIPEVKGQVVPEVKGETIPQSDLTPEEAARVVNGQTP